MISRTHRFHGLGSLRHVYTHGRTVRSPLLAVKFELNPRRSAYRAAVVVSRKVHKSAVVRNRIRRRIYEIVRRSEPGIVQPYDIVITVFSEEVAAMDAPALEAMVRELLKKSSITSPMPSATPNNHGIVEQIPKENP